MHKHVMRTHPDIVKAIGPDAVAALTGSSIHTIRSWMQRGRIPAEHWLVLVSEGHCTAEELMHGVPERRTGAAA